MCRFASVTVNLGPTFLSGALAANAGAVMDEPSCPLVQVTGGRLGFLNFDIHTFRKQLTATNTQKETYLFIMLI